MLKLSVLLSLRNFLDAKLLHVLGVCKLFRQKVEKRRESGRFFRQTLFLLSQCFRLVEPQWVSTSRRAGNGHESIWIKPAKDNTSIIDKKCWYKFSQIRTSQL